MRIQMKLSKATVIAFNEFKRKIYGDPNIEITNGYVLGAAYNLIKEELENIDWEEVKNRESEIVRESQDKSVEGVHTTLNIDSAISEGINKLQNAFLNEFKTTRIHRSFVVKLVMFATLLHHNNELPKKEIK
ncbi:hypothetical protein [Bacillus sp. V59.32b]|uniref:hypothetical protein n=1 Tax=Bacillus sp. V59.32b TaxID=1758642 RepID=UPI000E3E4C45|nr:hypothetical protein [Bacillus sp. V59.32b]RFU64454.1 hypothetical protein D0463_10080 [Bacillus sp. V59.32b]